MGQRLHVDSRHWLRLCTPRPGEVRLRRGEKVLRREYQIRTPNTMQMYAKQSGGHLEELKRELNDGGFYDGIEYDVRPMPSRLGKADIRDRVEALCARFGNYEGPVRSGSKEKKHTLLSPEQVFAWLRQFPAEFGEQPLQLLEEMILVGRPQVVSALDGFVGSDQGELVQVGFDLPLGRAEGQLGRHRLLVGRQQTTPSRCGYEALVTLLPCRRIRLCSSRTSSAPVSNR